MNYPRIGTKHTIIKDGIRYSGERRKEILEMEWWQQIQAAAHSIKVGDILTSTAIMTGLYGCMALTMSV